MANTFALILVLVTLFTGIIWCLDKLVWAPKRNAKKEDVRAKAGGSIDEATLNKVAPQPSWVETSVSIFPVIAVVLVVRSFIYEPFQIPSGSMMPTLLVGDFILVEKFAYGIKDPIFQKTLIKTGEPKRGDIAVFKYPEDPSLDYIKRVVGLPGDTIVYQDKQLFIKPACPTGKACLPLTKLEYSNIHPSPFYQGNAQLIEATEQLGKVGHNILINPYMPEATAYYYTQTGKPVGEWVVPEGEYFVMGDNRDNSKDSRFWGFVPNANLVGKAVAIWMSFDKEPGEWPTGVRLNRIGAIH
ncbi:MAG: signal peptidase I [Plesiomonas sp.]|uniref:signal peptidase I n=1 Tax=Plesiomonas sp. TaxID=2486279 RepID=UPI003F355647